MKKITTILLVQIILLTTLNGQIFKPNKTKLYQSLIEEVYIMTLFVDTREDEWTEDEINYYYKELEKSQEWLIEQAQRYNQNVRFENDYFFDNKEIIYSESANMSNSRYLLKNAMEELRYDDFDDFLSHNQFDFENNKLKFIFFVKSNSRSHAYNFWSLSSVDIAIVYCRSTYGTITDHYVISHELLHQFGAWDLYYMEKASRLKKQKKQKNYTPIPS